MSSTSLITDEKYASRCQQHVTYLIQTKGCCSDAFPGRTFVPISGCSQFTGNVDLNDHRLQSVCCKLPVFKAFNLSECSYAKNFQQKTCITKIKTAKSLGHESRRKILKASQQRIHRISGRSEAVRHSLEQSMEYFSKAGYECKVFQLQQ